MPDPTPFPFQFRGETLHALPAGALFWPAQELLCVSDLHLGKARRYARAGGAVLPPYEVSETLERLDAALELTRATTVVCLGDSFDDIHASHDLTDHAHDWLMRMQAGRRWIWIEGNHDPGPVNLAGRHLAKLTIGPLTFRHIAEDTPQAGEISGHYHPKARVRARGRVISRRCFVCDSNRIIMPAFGTYTGGLSVKDPAISGLLSQTALCLLTGHSVQPVPLKSHAVD